MYPVVPKVSIAHVIARTGTLLDMFSNVHLDVPFCRCITAPRSRSCRVQSNSRTITFFHLHHVTQHRTRLLLNLVTSLSSPDPSISDTSVEFSQFTYCVSAPHAHCSFVTKLKPTAYDCYEYINYESLSSQRRDTLINYSLRMF